jgi:hypothetical protein
MEGIDFKLLNIRTSFSTEPLACQWGRNGYEKNLPISKPTELANTLKNDGVFVCNCHEAGVELCERLTAIICGVGLFGLE